MYPILFHLGPITVYSFGFFLVVAYLIATFIFWKEGKRQGYNEEKLLDLSLIALIGAFISGRVFFIFTNYDLFQGDLGLMITFWEGGFTYYGAVLGLLLAVFLVTRKWKWPFLQIADFGVLASMAAYVIVKIGTFLAGIDYGTLTSLPWGFELATVSGSRHPVQIYEAFFVGSFFIVMKVAYEKNLKSTNFRSGKVFFLAVFVLAVARLIFGFLRGDVTYISGVRLDQIVSLLVAIAAVFSIYYLRLRDLRRDIGAIVKSLLSINSKALKELRFWR